MPPLAGPASQPAVATVNWTVATGKFVQLKAAPTSPDRPPRVRCCRAGLAGIVQIAGAIRAALTLAFRAILACWALSIDLASVYIALRAGKPP